MFFLIFVGDITYNLKYEEENSDDGRDYVAPVESWKQPLRAVG